MQVKKIIKIKAKNLKTKYSMVRVMKPISENTLEN